MTIRTIISAVIAAVMVFLGVVNVSAQNSLALEQFNQKSTPRATGDIFTSWDLEEYPFGDHYPSVDELYAWYDETVTKYPDLVTKIHIGYSWEGRDLWVLQITSDDDTQVDYKPGVLVDGLIHADEWSTTQVAAYFVWRLLTDYDTDATAHWLLNNRRIYVMPMLNPDGYAFDGNGEAIPGHFWRKNMNNTTPTDYIGVDLNRNCDHYWDLGISDPGSRYYRGEAPFSEYETECMRQFMLSNGIDSYLNLHSYGGALLFPWAHPGDPSPHDSWFRGVAAHMASLTSVAGDEDLHYSYGQPYEFGINNATGSVMDWCYAVTGAQAFGFEIDTCGYGGYPITELIVTINEDVFDALVYQAMISDIDLGVGSSLLFPPVPYIVYGKVTDLDDTPVTALRVVIQNIDTEETISIATDMNGYYELNLGNLIEYSHSITDAFAISACTASTNFTICNGWGIELDIEIAVHDLNITCTHGGLVRTPGAGVFTYPDGTVAYLEATPKDGYRFVRWTGDVSAVCDVSAASTNITMQGDYSITANFEKTHVVERALIGVLIALVIAALVVFFVRRRKAA